MVNSYSDVIIMSFIVNMCAEMVDLRPFDEPNNWRGIFIFYFCIGISWYRTAHMASLMTYNIV